MVKAIALSPLSTNHDGQIECPTGAVLHAKRILPLVPPDHSTQGSFPHTLVLDSTGSDLWRATYIWDNRVQKSLGSWISKSASQAGRNASEPIVHSLDSARLW
jgi:hypothetical protein